ncbi:MAG: UDP-N-acetylglucosamine diphosphorylase/glucosamine-1-phosphate N-acetyltransferase [Deltaproteobacteria bacterium]|nr:MAG: UDP-N-acetylglucosamine diphosphorylase/glucosamine-1-phosphate N-acetyltransferase [Deltaproteobacteria bacterium]
MTAKRACVVLAAGDGKRMRSDLPKVLHPVCGEPMLTYPVELALAAGFDPVVVVISPQGRQVRRLLEQRFGKRVRLAVQRRPLGTAHAVLAARRQLAGFSGQLAIVYGDVPLLERADVSALLRAGRSASLVLLTCRPDDPSGYGRLVRDERGRPRRIVEHRDADAATRRIGEVNAGLYLVDCPWVFRALARLGRGNAQGEYYLTDLLELARRRGLAVRALERPGARRILGVNDRLQLAEAERELNRRLCARLQRRGVTIEDPASTWLGPRVSVGRDSVIRPGCYLRGEVKIGPRCRLGPGAVLSDCRLAADVEVGAWCVLDSCRVESGARLGPFARLRPGARIGRGARVGNFVEVKNSRLGPGAKANHLTYLGDADIGEGANVGAGTITCNYDGVHKHRTVIGAGAFIGSNTELVAPVTVGRDAVVGAGTTVTSDVPDEALAVSRVRQKNLPGYRRRR